MKLILASNSPRRRELLAGLGLDFEVRVLPGIEENYPDELREGDIPLYISRLKAEAYRSSLAADELLITADTIVWLEGKVLGKPHSEGEAKEMLRLLSGKTHQVYTAVTFAEVGSQQSAISSQQPEVRMTTEVDCCDVTFEPLSETDIDYYVSHYRPLDKAGAYGIQEWIGYIAVSKISGSFYTVMGFPTHLVHKYLQRL